MTYSTSQTCERMLALLTVDVDNDHAARLEQAIEAHITTCPVCAAGEHALTTLIAAYRRAAAPLTEDFERRLLAQMCAAHNQ